VGRATEDELREALAHFKRGTVEGPAEALTPDPENQIRPQDVKYRNRTGPNNLAGETSAAVSRLQA